MFEILAAIVDGPAPLGRVEVPIRPGLNALYGRNGAGKTRLLTALSGLTRSTPINSDPIDPPLQFVVRPLNEAMLVEHISASHEKRIGENHVDLELRFGPFPWRRGPYSALETVVGDALIEQWNSYPTWGRCSQDHSDHPRQVDVVNEVLHNMTWILAMGTKGWDLHLGIRFCEETPILINQRQRVIDELRTIYKRNPGSSEVRPDDFPEEISRTNRHLLTGDLADHLCRRDFFTVLGPLYDPYGEEDEFEQELCWMQEHGNLIYISTLCGNIVSGPLCEHRTEQNLIPFDDMPLSTVRLIRASHSTLGHAEDLRPRFEAEEQLRQMGFGSQPHMLVASDSAVCIAPWVKGELDQLVALVNSLLKSMLPEPPLLECEITTPERWAFEDACRWMATDLTGTRVGLEELSGAQTRLVRLAFTLAFDAYRRQKVDVEGSKAAVPCTPALMLLDEPEAGLHRLAEDTLTQGLDDFGRRNDVAVVAATHSPSFLRNPNVALVEVFRKADGWTSARPVEFPDGASVNALGISRADLLQLYQLVLLVEGHHDRVVLGEVLGRELARRRVLMLPLRGSYNLNAVVDLEILAHTLEQPVLSVLDNVRAEVIDGLWHALKGLPQDAGAVDIDTIFEQRMGPKSDRSDEERQIAALAGNLFQAGGLDRFGVYGLTRRDIIEYLPVERLVPNGVSWSELRSQHAQRRADAPTSTPKDFKKWLATSHDADFGDDGLLIAASLIAESPPDEFLLLLARIDSIIDGWTR